LAVSTPPTAKLLVTVPVAALTYPVRSSDSVESDETAREPATERSPPTLVDPVTLTDAARNDDFVVSRPCTTKFPALDNVMIGVVPPSNTSKPEVASGSTEKPKLFLNSVIFSNNTCWIVA